MKQLILLLIAFYQKTISPDHGWLGTRLFGSGVCRFQPTCSEYMKEAILKRGIITGLRLGSERVLRCHPWNAGGYDPVPKI